MKLLCRRLTELNCLCVVFSQCTMLISCRRSSLVQGWLAVDRDSLYQLYYTKARWVADWAVYCCVKTWACKMHLILPAVCCVCNFNISHRQTIQAIIWTVQLVTQDIVTWPVRSRCFVNHCFNCVVQRYTHLLTLFTQLVVLVLYPIASCVMHVYRVDW